MTKHKNPTGFWTHQGAYSVELTPGTPTTNVMNRDGVSVTGTTVHIKRGKGRLVTQSMGAIDFHLGDGTVAHWSYAEIVRIRNGNGKLIWQNNSVK